MSTPARLTRSVVKKNPNLDFEDAPFGQKTPGKKAVKKLDLSDKENASPNKTPKVSKKKATTPKKASSKKTPKSTKKKVTTPKSSGKKSKDSAKKGSAKKASATKTATPKSSQKKAAIPKSSGKKKAVTPENSETNAKPLSKKVKDLAKKIATNNVSAEDLANMFTATASTLKHADAVAAEEGYVLVDSNGPSEEMVTPSVAAPAVAESKCPKLVAEKSGSSSDLTVMTVCSLSAYAAAHYLPAQINGQLPGIGPIENPSALAVALICSVIFALGFRFAASWSRSKEHAVNVFRVSFGLATVFVSLYTYSCCEQKFRSVLTISTLGFAVFELIHLWNVECVGGYFRIAVNAMIGTWSLMLMASSSKESTMTVEYNTFLLLIFTVGNILAATDAIHTHFTVGTYMVATLSIYIWAIQNGRIPADNMGQAVKIGVLTFAPTLIAVLDQLKPKSA